ncbi:MAG TPA: hypothetical protein VJC05_02565 [Candidatus Andersenbacteria bacterium]|nr:hypothetical protein [Candidatus Andersenbacteria bacterium]
MKIFALVLVVAASLLASDALAQNRASLDRKFRQAMIAHSDDTARAVESQGNEIREIKKSGTPKDAEQDQRIDQIIRQLSGSAPASDPSGPFKTTGFTSPGSRAMIKTFAEQQAAKQAAGSTDPGSAAVSASNLPTAPPSMAKLELEYFELRFGGIHEQGAQLLAGQEKLLAGQTDASGKLDKITERVDGLTKEFAADREEAKRERQKILRQLAAIEKRLSAPPVNVSVNQSMAPAPQAHAYVNPKK